MFKLNDNQKSFLRSQSDIIVECLPEDLQIKGNASAIDDETDAQVEREILEQLDSGNEWAWCTIKVSLKWKGYEGTDYLGACSYKSKKDFIDANDYFPDMVDQAFNDLVSNIESDIDSTLDDMDELNKVG
jgi:hypothetical protein